MATFFKDLLRSATESEFPLAPFTSPTFFLTSRKKYFRPHTILKGLVQAVKRISGLSWDQETADSLKVGTMMATLLSQWLNPDGIPEPHPPNWRMDRVFRLVWTDEAKTEGRLESIPTDERSTGHRTQSRLEEDTRGGHFKAHPALRCVLVNDGPFDLVDDLAERLNGIVINKSENGTFGLASTHSFRQVLFSTSYHPSTPAPHHPPMVAPHPPFTATFWKNKILHNTCNGWWRFLINKLFSSLYLHFIIPDMAGPLCHICGTEPETSQHLLFSCAKKLEVCQGTLSKYVEERAWTADYICTLFYPGPDSVEPLHEFPSSS